MLLGIPNLDPNTGYNATQDPDVSLMFNTVALRYGHTQVNNVTWRLNPDGTHAVGGDILLRNVFFDTTIASTYGCSAIYQGLGAKVHNSPEVNIVEDLQEYLFAMKGHFGLDLLSINMRRAREVGLPNLSEARQLYSLPPWTDFNFTCYPEQFFNAYGTTDPSTCDPWICGMLEPNPSTQTSVFGELGTLFYAIVKRQFEAIRNGDRFWYLNNQFDASDLNDILGTKLSHIILRNSAVTSLKCDIFEVPGNSYTGVTGPYCTSSSTTTGSSDSSRIVYSAFVLIAALIAALAL